MSNTAPTIETFPHAKALSLSEQVAPTERPLPLIAPEPCDVCEGFGIIDVARIDQHPIERPCYSCDGTGFEIVGLHEADDRAVGVTHVWSSERSYYRDEPAVCGADPVDDVVAHQVGRYPHCSTCLAVKLAQVSK